MRSDLRWKTRRQGRQDSCIIVWNSLCDCDCVCACVCVSLPVSQTAALPVWSVSLSVWSDPVWAALCKQSITHKKDQTINQNCASHHGGAEGQVGGVTDIHHPPSSQKGFRFLLKSAWHISQ